MLTRYETQTKRSRSFPLGIHWRWTQRYTLSRRQRGKNDERHSIMLHTACIFADKRSCQPQPYSGRVYASDNCNGDLWRKRPRDFSLTEMVSEFLSHRNKEGGMAVSHHVLAHVWVTCYRRGQQKLSSIRTPRTLSGNERPEDRPERHHRY